MSPEGFMLLAFILVGVFMGVVMGFIIGSDWWWK